MPKFTNRPAGEAANGANSVGRGAGPLCSGCLRTGFLFFFLLVLFKGKSKAMGWATPGGSEEPCAKVTGLSSAVTRRDFLAFIKRWLRVGVPALPSSSKIKPVLWLLSSQSCLGES